MSGFIEEFELKTFFRKSLLPDILTGKVDPATKSHQFMERNGFKGRISLEEFTNFYLNKSVMISSDTKFKADCIDEWLLRDEDANAFVANQAAVCSRNRSPRRPKTVSFSVLSKNSSEVSLSPINSAASPKISLEVIEAAVGGQAILDAQTKRFDSSDSLASTDLHFQNTTTITVDGSTDNEDEEDDRRFYSRLYAFDLYSISPCTLQLLII